MGQSPIKVMYIDHVGQWSGGEIALIHLIGQLDRALYLPVVVVAEEGAMPDYLRQRGIKVYVMPMPKRTRTLRRKDLWRVLLGPRVWWDFLRYVMQLRKLIIEEDVDIIHTNALKATVYGSISAKLAGKPAIVHVHDHLSAPYLNTWVAHAMHWFIRRMATLVVANSSSTGVAVRCRTAQGPEIVYSGVPTASYEDAVTQPKNNSGPLRVVCVGRLTYWKGQHIALNAMRYLRDEGVPVSLTIAGTAMFGEDKYADSLSQYAYQNNLTNVRFEGFVDNVPALLQTMDVLIHTSVYPEPFGQTIVEGMAAGLPVIATDAGGPQEIVVEGKTGFLIPPGDARALANAIKALNDDPQLRQRMGQLGRERARAMFDIAVTAKHMAAVYKKLQGHYINREHGRAEVTTKAQ